MLGSVLWLVLALPASGQRLLEEWRVRTTAGPEALATGPAAVFWNPASASVTGTRGEISLIDLRAPRMTGVDGLAAAAAALVNERRTTLAVGFEHMDVSGIEHTTTSPDGGAPIDVAENRFGVAAAHTVNERTRVGVMVQYTRLPEISEESSVLALGAGVRAQPVRALPLTIAGMAATEGRDPYWMAGVEIASPWPLRDWRLRGEYGLAGGKLTPGATHRLAAVGEWREAVELSLGTAIEPDAGSHTIEPIAAASIRLYRYRIGMVRERLPNGFGAAYSFRFNVAF